MKVITGEAKGRNLRSVEGMDTRPTSDQNKKSIFNAIQFDIEGRRVLDLFAGTGQLGIEALSRGAKEAVFADCAPAAIKVIRANLQTVKMEDRAQVLQGDYQSVLGRFPKERFGLIFLDPPYERGMLQDAVTRIMERELLCNGGMIVCEGQFGEEMPEGIRGCRIYRTYKYGRTAVTLYVRTQQEGGEEA